MKRYSWFKQETEPRVSFEDAKTARGGGKLLQLEYGEIAVEGYYGKGECTKRFENPIWRPAHNAVNGEEIGNSFQKINSVR